MMISDRPEATASSTTYWIIGLSTSGSISLGCAFVAGRKRVPRPAAGKTALRTFMTSLYVAHPSGPSTSQEQEGRDVGDDARQRPDRHRADQQRQGDASQEIDQVRNREDRVRVQELDDLPDIGPLKIR